MFFKNTSLLALPVAILVCGSLVVLLLAFGETHFELGATLVPVQVERYQCKSLALNGADQPVEFLTVQQQLAASSRVGLYVCGRGLQRLPGAADRPHRCVKRVGVSR